MIIQKKKNYLKEIKMEHSRIKSYHNKRRGQVLWVAALLILNVAKIYIKQFSECLYDLIIDCEAQT